MTVTVVCDVLGKSNNGSTVAAKNLIDYLRGRGHTVKVLCADCENENKDGYYIVPSFNFLIFNKYVESNGVSLAKPDEDIIRSAISGSDIVHIMFPFALGIESAKIAVKMNIPVSAGFHMLAENVTSQLHLDDFHLSNKLAYSVFHELYKNCDAIHFPTRYLKELYEGMYGKAAGYVITNGVNKIFKPKDIKKKDGYIRILTIGRYSREKSQHTVIDAIKRSRHKDVIRLTVAGTGPLKEELEHRAKSLPIPAVFELYSRGKLVDIINESDIYIHPAKIEAEGISCLEAMSCGTVPIISDSPKCATKDYALTEQSLFKYGSASDLARKIDWWIENPAEREKYGKLYAETAAKKFNQEACMKKMEEMLIQTVERIRQSEI